MPPNSQSVRAELGERNIIEAGAEYSRQNAILLADSGDSEAIRIRPNYWRIRFALPEEGSGNILALNFDELAQRVTGSRRLDITPVPITNSALRPSDASPATGGSGFR
ncbi:hypothetical protein ACQKGO_11010 [Corallococcus interemptor]|uniref:hypothetical protein n=1 Tax=Corallococcus interemptor TaxID=2316720 RepID=UPI003D07945F